ncbi:unannotated protein [freshwater metagenome]|uniref:Unannotated protein n=1 Tax=freshwater metagenome TaxID=449393 RepID=A0A6J6M198_9ZZZZ
MFPLPESGIVPAVAFDPVGADAKLPAVLPPATARTIVGVPLPAAFTANTRYMYCVPATKEPTACGDVADVVTLVQTAPSVDDCTTYPVNALVPVSVGTFHVSVSPPFVAVAVNTPTRPGTPPIAYVRATVSIDAAMEESADCSPANADVGSALFSLTAWLRAGCVTRRGATGIAIVDWPAPAEDSARTRK